MTEGKGMSSARERGIEQLASAIVAEELDEEITLDDECNSRNLGVVAARRLARRWFDELGLVAVDPVLVEAVEKAQEAARRTREERSSAPSGTDIEQMFLARSRHDVHEVTLARLRLADAVLAQLRGRQ